MLKRWLPFVPTWSAEPPADLSMPPFFPTCTRPGSLIGGAWWHPTWVTCSSDNSTPLRRRLRLPSGKVLLFCLLLPPRSAPFLDDFSENLRLDCRASFRSPLPLSPLHSALAESLSLPLYEYARMEILGRDQFDELCALAHALNSEVKLRELHVDGTRYLLLPCP